MSEKNRTRAAGGRRMVKTRTAGVFKREPHGTYQATWTDLDGRRRTKTCATYEEAKAVKAEAEEAKRRGERRAPSRQTVAEYLREWLRTYTGRTGRGISDHTLMEYRRDLERYVIPAIGRVRLAALSRDDGRALVADLRRQRLQPRTIRRVLTPLRAALADAVEDPHGALAHNPLAGVRVPFPRRADDDERPERALTDAQVAAIIEHAPERHRLLLRVAALTAMRRGELLALRWRDVDSEAGAIHVRRRLRAGQVGPPKSDKGRRSIPVPGALLDDLGLARATSMHPGPDDYVFASATGSALTEGAAHRNAMKPAAAAAGVPWAAFHDLRRAAISRWIMAGLTPKVVQQIAGHHAAAFTLDVYAKVRPGDLPVGDRLAL